MRHYCVGMDLGFASSVAATLLVRGSGDGFEVIPFEALPGADALPLVRAEWDPPTVEVAAPAPPCVAWNRHERRKTAAMSRRSR